MSCLSDISFPSYLQTIIREIQLGNDQAKKTCICNLKVPLKEDGCPILDSDNKAGAFHACLEVGTPPSNGSDTNFPFSINLAEISKIYWQQNGSIW